MDLDALLYHYLGTDDPASAPPAAIAEAADRIAIDFGTERDSGRRFALWAMMLMLGRAPDPELAFKDERERRAAHDIARMMARDEAAGGDAAA